MTPICNPYVFCQDASSKVPEQNSHEGSILIACFIWSAFLEQFCYYFLPETKGKSLEEIEEYTELQTSSLYYYDFINYFRINLNQRLKSTARFLSLNYIFGKQVLESAVFCKIQSL